MIKYALKCAQGHQFDSWFQDGATYDRLHKAGHLSCVMCGDTAVSKAIMAPRVSTNDDKPLSAPDNPTENNLKELRKKVERESDYVGQDFAAEARRIDSGEADSRSIWGQATVEDAKSLAKEGIPVIPLPFGPRKVN